MYMTEGLLLKFGQNEDLKKVLLDTGDKIIAEASPFDKLWGIGIDETTAIKNKNQWKGLNWLGECLMNVRAQLKL